MKCIQLGRNHRNVCWVYKNTFQWSCRPGTEEVSYHLNLLFHATTCPWPVSHLQGILKRWVYSNKPYKGAFQELVQHWVFYSSTSFNSLLEISSIQVNSAGSRTRLREFELFHLLVVWPWENCLFSLCLSFLIC